MAPYHAALELLLTCTLKTKAGHCCISFVLNSNDIDISSIFLAAVSTVVAMPPRRALPAGPQDPVSRAQR